MAQEVNTLTTNNSTGGGFFGGLFTGIASLVTAVAPVATNAYQLKLQADTLQNQSANQLATLQLQQQQAAAAVKPAATPTWYPWAIGGGIVLLIGLLIVRARSR